MVYKIYTNERSNNTQKRQTSEWVPRLTDSPRQTNVSSNERRKGDTDREREREAKKHIRIPNNKFIREKIQMICLQSSQWWRRRRLLLQNLTLFSVHTFPAKRLACLPAWLTDWLSVCLSVFPPNTTVYWLPSTYVCMCVQCARVQVNMNRAAARNFYLPSLLLLFCHCLPTREKSQRERERKKSRRLACLLATQESVTPASYLFVGVRALSAASSYSRTKRAKLKSNNKVLVTTYTDTYSALAGN